MKTQYTITSYEVSEGTPVIECLIGVYRSVKAAQRMLKKLKREALKKYDDEFVGLEDDMIIILKSCVDTRFTYSLVINEERN